VGVNGDCLAVINKRGCKTSDVIAHFLGVSRFVFKDEINFFGTTKPDHLKPEMKTS
jgi:hypothetical protein